MPGLYRSITDVLAAREIVAFHIHVHCVQGYKVCTLPGFLEQTPLGSEFILDIACLPFLAAARQPFHSVGVAGSRGSDSLLVV